MAIYRGAGGSGDATGDAANASALALASANQAQDSATSAAASATTASTAAASTAGSVAAAATSATNAATSATTATTQAGIATTKASEAATSVIAAQLAETNAETAEANAATSASAASTSASNASTSASNASTSATTASTAATNAGNSASAASTSATSAASSATAASGSATSASGSASTATTQASNAASSASSASTSAATATTQATNASSSASDASTSATNAATSATNAASSATSASGSATTATTQASNAAASATSAAASYDSFDDRYLGAKSSAPTLDNDGNTLLTGALYFNTVDNAMKVWSGSAWLNAYASLSGALIATNNLSDLTNTTTARSNLGLGTLATQSGTFSGTSSGINTGDQTNISGNAATATTATNLSGGSVAATTISGTDLTTTGNTILGNASTDTLNVGNGGLVKDASGNVGIGTTSPRSLLDVVSSSADALINLDGDSSASSYLNFRIAGTNKGYIGLGAYTGGSNDNLAYWTSGAGSHLFYTNSALKMTLASSGNLGIGTATPSAPLTFAAATGRKAGFYQGTEGYSIGVESSNFKFVTDASAVFTWANGSTYSSATEYMRLDSSGNLGLGVTPNTWSLGKAMEVNSGGNALWSAGPADIRLTAGAYYNGAYKYGNTGSLAAAYEIGGGTHIWRTAPSGTINNNISFTQAMTLNPSGNLSVTGTVAGSNITSGGNVTGSSTSCTGNAATVTNGVYTTDFTNSLAANGYQKIAGGTIIQWGTTTTTALATVTVTLPIAFPNACRSITLGNVTNSSTGSGGSFGYVNILSTSQIQITNDYVTTNNSMVYYWIAIGY